MKGKSYIKINYESTQDVPLLTHIVKHTFLEIKEAFLLDSKRVMNPVITIGNDGYDFIDNLQTILFHYDYFKIPRIIKNILK